VAEWKKIITSGSNASLNNIETNSQIVVNGNLFTSSSEAPKNNPNLKVVVHNDANNQLLVTESYSEGSTSQGIQVKLSDVLGSGNFIEVQNLKILNYKDNIEIGINGGELEIKFNQKASS
jgi:hypothetical protein|tara:strand:- start:146 stop:505 length:360 start_codon:yes stop_codon:yes gene_type:complete